jgi:Uma2 family endonuclease
MTAIPQPAALVEIEYPESDGKPMGESDRHRNAIMDLITALSDRYREDPDTYVSGDLFVYYEQGNPRAVICPDVFVAFGVPKGDRPSYKLWQEPRPPTVVVEISSPSTAKEDFGDKQAVCAMLGVQEYFVYDPDFEYLSPQLQGFRLLGGAYRSIPSDMDGGVRSARLGLTFYPRRGEALAVVDTLTGEGLLGDAEARETCRSAEVARGVAESRLDQEHQARIEAEDARRQAEAENERLRTELARLRSAANG